MNENPEIRAKVLEWQRRHNIQDNDPALALIELLDVYYRQPVVVQAATADGKAGVPAINPEAVSDAVRSAITPAIERLGAQMRDLEFKERPSGGPQVSVEAIADQVRAAIQPGLDRVAASAAEAGKVQAPPISADVLSEAIRTSLLPSLDRVTFQLQELQRRMESTNVEESVKRIEGFHDNIDYCTKKLDVVKKEADTLVLKLEKASAEIKPITRGAVVMLMLVTGVVGYVLAVILR